MSCGWSPESVSASWTIGPRNWATNIRCSNCRAIAHDRRCKATGASCTASTLAARVRAFNAQHGLTLFMTMTAALSVLLYRYSGQTDLRIGAPVANRIRPESEGLIGAFLNTQVLRCQLDGQMRVGELSSPTRTCRSIIWWKPCNRRAAPPTTRCSR